MRTSTPIWFRWWPSGKVQQRREMAREGLVHVDGAHAGSDVQRRVAVGVEHVEHGSLVAFLLGNARSARVHRPEITRSTRKPSSGSIVSASALHVELPRPKLSLPLLQRLELRLEPRLSWSSSCVASDVIAVGRLLAWLRGLLRINQAQAKRPRGIFCQRIVDVVVVRRRRYHYL